MSEKTKKPTLRKLNLEWNAYRSKWKSALDRKLSVDLKGDENILYLGASTGSTISHIRKKTKGIIFAVEKSPKMMVELMKLAIKSDNIAPIFADARNVEEIKKRLFKKKIDILFQDIPSPDQVEMLSNAAQLVDKDCRIFLSLKIISVAHWDPETVLKKTEEKLKEHFKITESASLEPFHKKHYFYVLKKK